MEPVLHAFSDAAAMESFLDEHHTTAPEFTLKIAKKGSGIPTVSREEAVEVALCFGWIDGKGHTIDQDWHTTRFTPRRAKSLWSEKNVDTVSRLTDAGRMRPAGLAAVEAAQADGRWQRAYPRPSTISEPADFSAALAQNPAAEKYYATLNRSERYAVLLKVHTASPTARAGRVHAMVDMLEKGATPSLGLTKKSSASKAKERPTKVVKARAPRTRTAKPATATKPKGKAAPASSTPAGEGLPSRRSGLRPRN